MVRQTIFKYKTIKGPLHKIPAIYKFLLLLPISIICMSLPSFGLCIGIVTAIIIAFISRFTLREQLTDFKPALLYALLMYSLSFFSNIFNFYNSSIQIEHTSLFSFNYSLFSVFIPNNDFIRIALRLVLIIQVSALFFRTTSSMELRECLMKIIPRFAENIALFLSFIPEVFETWSKINMAWKARGGKQGIRKIKMLIFVLISLSFEKAAIKAKALEVRKK